MENNEMKLDRKVEGVTKDKNNYMQIIKGSILAMIITLVCLTIYATLLSYTEISENTIIPVVLVIEGVSILIASSLSTIKLKKQGMLKGGLIGVIYAIALYIISSILIGSFAINSNSIIMIVVCLVTGMIGGIIGINMKF